MTTKTEYRLTLDRPVQGRMRKAGATVHLSAGEAAAEAVWGGLEPVTAQPAPDAPDATADAEEAGAAKATPRRTKS